MLFRGSSFRDYSWTVLPKIQYDPRINTNGEHEQTRKDALTKFHFRLKFFRSLVHIFFGELNRVPARGDANRQPPLDRFTIGPRDSGVNPPGARGERQRRAPILIQFRADRRLSFETLCQEIVKTSAWSRVSRKLALQGFNVNLIKLDRHVVTLPVQLAVRHRDDELIFTSQTGGGFGAPARQATIKSRARDKKRRQESDPEKHPDDYLRVHCSQLDGNIYNSNRRSLSRGSRHDIGAAHSGLGARKAENLLEPVESNAQAR